MSQLSLEKRDNERIDLMTVLIMGVYFIISVFESYLNRIVGSYTKYYIFVVMLVLVYKEGFRLQLRHLSLAYIAWLGWKLISLLWSEDMSAVKLHFISQLGMVLFLVVIVSSHFNTRTIACLQDIYWLASAAMGVLAIFFSQAYHGVADARQVVVILGVEIDPNNLAALLLIGIAISVSNILFDKKKYAISVLVLLINILGCFNTGSRSSLVTIVALGVFCVFYSPQKSTVTSILKKMTILVITVAAAYFIATRFLSETTFERLFDLSGYEGGTGRGEKWGSAFELLTRDFATVILGAGWGTATIYNDKGTGLHNTFISMLCDTGLLGTSIFLIPIVVIAVRLLKRGKPSMVILLGAQYAPAFFIDAINKRFFWNAIFLLFMAYYQPLENK